MKAVDWQAVEHRELIDVIEHAMRDSDVRQQLFNAALSTKQRVYDRRIFLRGLVEVSNHCVKTCQYCGINVANTSVERYRLDKATILTCCQQGYALGLRTFVLQGGEDPAFDDDFTIDLVSAIRHQFPDCAITLSLGERSFNSYQRLYAAGANRYLLRHETANPDIYRAMHPSMSYDNRRRCLYDLKSIGYQVGSGFLVGLPNQTVADFADDLLFLRDLKPAMVGIGPFIPHPATALAKQPAGSAECVLIMLAIARLMLRDVLLPATTALGTRDVNSRQLALLAGANVFMPNLTPQDSRNNYEIYRNKIAANLAAGETIAALNGLAQSLDMVIDMGRGDHVDWSK